MHSFLANLFESVAAEQGRKAAEKRQKIETKINAVAPPQAPPEQPAGDPFAALEQHMKTIDQAHAQTEADARQAYLDLLARMLPARTGTPPPPGSHALAEERTDGAPPPAEVLVILRGVNRTPEELRKDVKTLAMLRDLADKAARHDELFAAAQKVDDELHALQGAFEEVELEWTVKLEVKRRELAVAERLRDSAEQAARDLQRYQGVDQELRRLRFPTINERSKATPAELAQEKAAREKEATLQEQSLTLEARERAFFPAPPPPPEPASRDSTNIVYYTPREGRS